MSDAPQVSPSGSRSQAGSAPAKKPRSPVERMIVWGGIVVLLLLLAAQARARLGYQLTSSALAERVREDEGANPQALAVKDLNQYILGWPSRTVQERGKTEQVITLTWTGLSGPKGLFDPYGIDVRATVGPDAAVLEVIPHGAPEPPAPVADASEIGEGPPEGMMPMMPGGPGGGGPPMHVAEGGPGGGGPGGGINPMEQDADGDGKISKDEAQGRMKENFDRNDANADGFIDAEEVAALLERIQSRGAGGGGPGGRGRPEGESAPEGESPDATPPESGGTTEKPAEPAQPDAAKPEGDTETPPAGETSPDKGAP